VTRASKPLAGKRIVVTRPARQAEGLAQCIREAGGEALLVPAIEILPLADPAPFQALARRLDEFDLAIFVSRNAVRSALALLAGRPWPARLKVAAVGQGSREELGHFGFSEVVAPAARSDSESLLALPALAEVRGRRVAIFRGDGGRELLGEVLEKRGAIVEYVACYRRVRPSGEGLAALWSRGVDAVAISSAEGLENFLAMLGGGAVEKLAAAALFVPHERVAREAARRGLAHAVVCGPRDAEVAAALVAYFGGAR
jgi:uroporphyrinogen-III synthase